MSRFEFNARYINELVGVKYQSLGETRDGVNCVGLVCLFYREHGVDMPCPNSTDPSDVRLIFVDRWKEIDRPDYGDLAVMPGEASAIEGHVGIWTPLGILKAEKRHGVIIQPHGRAHGRVKFYRYQDTTP